MVFEAAVRGDELMWLSDRCPGQETGRSRQLHDLASPDHRLRNATPNARPLRHHNHRPGAFGCSGIGGSSCDIM
jgi:hypothetical protein